MGGSLQPDYFAERINLSVLLAPVGSTANIPSPGIRLAAKFLKVLEYAIVEKAKHYNWFPPVPTVMEGLIFACDMPLLKKACFEVLGMLNNQSVDDPKAAETFLSNEPSGASWRTFAYYAQSINSGRWSLYDYGILDNKKIYGSNQPPLVPIENYRVPTALFSGSLDALANPTDVANLSASIHDHVVFEKEYLLDHFSFVIAKDMTYFT